MKHLKRTLVLILILLTTIACGGDDDDGTGANGTDSVSLDNISKIIGTWKFTSSTTNGVPDSTDEPCQLMRTVEFTIDNAITTEYSGSSCSTQESTYEPWNINGNKLNIGGTKIEIVTLSSESITVKYSEGGDTIVEVFTKQ